MATKTKRNFLRAALVLTAALPMLQGLSCLTDLIPF
jgi:hypothetical protein